jgi:hypothetical protein
MADAGRLRREIREIASRPRAVKFGEIERVVNQLKLLGHETNKRPTKEGWIFRVDDVIFAVADHHPGSSQLRPRYVRVFLEAMAELGFYEE